MLSERREVLCFSYEHLVIIALGVSDALSGTYRDMEEVDGAIRATFDKVGGDHG